MLSDIRVSCSPHISKHLSTRIVMLDVIIALIPAMIAAVIFFRYHAAVLILTCCGACVITEWLCNFLRKDPSPWYSIKDLSAIVTAIILALSLPPALPFWAAIIGSVFAIAIGKMVFGGLGSNIFNPAMAGRAFMTACFGILMATWTTPATLNPDMPKLAATNTSIDARTQATPLAMSKEAIRKDSGAEMLNQRMIKYTFIGETGGCLGETSALAILIGGIYLLIRKTIDWRTPTAVLVSVFLCALVGYIFKPQAYVSPYIHLTSGSIFLCAFFIATDPVSAPLTPKGVLIFGAGVGIVTMLIRMVGEYPEGVMYAVLLMNSLTPLIDRFCKWIPAGGKPNV